MLWLQRLALHKRQIYLLHLYLVSAGVHCVVIVWCCMYSSVPQSHSMTVHAGALSEAPIVFMPMQRTVKQPQHNVVKPQPKKQVQQSAKKPVPSQQPKKVSAPQSVVAQVEKPKPKPKPVEKQQTKKVAHVDKAPDKASDVVAVGRDELAEVTLQRHVMEQLKKVWHPPAGVESDATCTICFAVDATGRAQKVIVEKPSGSTLYDIAVRSAVLRAEFPQSARTKEFTVAFKP